MQEVHQPPNWFSHDATDKQTHVCSCVLLRTLVYLTLKIKWTFKLHLKVCPEVKTSQNVPTNLKIDKKIICNYFYIWIIYFCRFFKLKGPNFPGFSLKPGKFEWLEAFLCHTGCWTEYILIDGFGLVIGQNQTFED